MTAFTNTMSWLAASVCLALLASPPAQAKGDDDHGAGWKEVEQELNLTDQQQAQVDQIRKEYHSRMEPLQEQLKALRNEKHDKIAAILTPEQQKTFEALRKRKKAWHGKDQP